MKISRTLRLLLTALPFAGGAGGLCLQAQTVHQTAYPFEKNGTVFAEGRAQPVTKSALSEQNAMKQAESAAQVSFLEYAISKAVRLPPEWRDLQDDIVRELAKTRAMELKTTGMTTVSRKVDAGGVHCVLSIPAGNLRAAAVATVGHWDENSILRGISGNRLLRFEAAERIGKQLDFRELIGATSASNDILVAVVEGAPVGRLPKLWQIGKDAFDKQQIETWPVQALVAGFNEAAGRDDISAKILAEFSRRNLARVARRLAGLKFPLSSAHILKEAGMAELKAGAIAELNDGDGIGVVILLHDGLLLLKESPVQDAKLMEADNVFSQVPVDFGKVRELALQSLMNQTSSEAFNLVGRTHELQDKPRLAAWFYFQSYMINNRNPYAATNLALVFDRIGKEKSSIWWMREALKNERLPAWSKQKLDALRVRYQEAGPES